MRIPGIRSVRHAPVALLGLALLVGPGPVRAQPVEIPPTWGGDLLSRPRLTGDWFGLRDELGKKGVVFDVDLLLTPQGVAGGRDTGADFWGTESAPDDLPEAITPPDDPAAMIKSLGPPPIRGHETAALHYFDAVYAKAAALAIALAAASGLLMTDEEDDDSEMERTA